MATEPGGSKIKLRKLVLNRDSMTTLTDRQAEAVKGGAIVSGSTSTGTVKSTVMCLSTGNCCITLW